MDWQSILLSVLGIIITALASWAAERVIALINSKLNNSKYAKYLTDAVNIITGAVKTTYQTYVQELKDKNMFTADAQKQALAKASDMAISQLTNETKDYIAKNFGEVESWINNQIESVIYDLKNINNNN